MDKNNSVQQTQPTELVDFSMGSNASQHVKITDHIKCGPVSIGRFVLIPSSGAVLGPAQYLVLVQEGESFELEWRLPKDTQSISKRMEPGHIHIHPSDVLVYKRWPTSSRMLFMAIDRIFVKQTLEEVFMGSPMDIGVKFGVRDSVIEGMSAAWREELMEKGAGGRIHAEALATSLIVHLFRIYGEGTSEIRIATGGMNGGRLRRVLDYIESHLNEDIGLGVLAAIAGYSGQHFSEVFKAETGLAPHHFLIDRRIHRAKELLLSSDMSIAHIAVEVGFSGQSHFTEQFRKSTGTTPGRFRQDRT